MLQPGGASAASAGSVSRTRGERFISYNISITLSTRQHMLWHVGWAESGAAGEACSC